MANPQKQPALVDVMIQQAATLPRHELLQLQDAINGLVQATEPQVIDLEEKRKERTATSTAATAQQGWIETAYKNINGKQYGPYRYLRYRTGGVKKSVYLGKVVSDA